MIFFFLGASPLPASGFLFSAFGLGCPFPSAFPPSAFASFPAAAAFFPSSVDTAVSAFTVVPAFSVSLTAVCSGFGPASAAFTLLSSAAPAAAPPPAPDAAPPPKCLRTSAIASSSTELCAAFTSYPLSCKKATSSLLCLSSSFASSCTFIFAMLTTSNYFESTKCFRIESANPASVTARQERSSLPIACPSISFSL